MRAPTFLFLASLAATAVACRASAPSATVTVPNTPLGPDAAPSATLPEDASPDTVRERARKVLARPADFESAKRLEINKQFPGAEQIKDSLVRVGAPWNEDDWFGETPPEHWEVKIGVDVGVPAAQAVIAACALHASGFRVILMTGHGVFENHRRIYVGALDTKPTKPPSHAALLEMLKPGLTSERFRRLAGRVEGPESDGEDGD